MPLESFDFIAAENYVLSHFNTGWTWVRSTPATIAVYERVLELDMDSVSRDQIRTNEVLGTADSRVIEGTDELKMEFVTA